ncbi:hypothetical protein BDA96_04G026600 [Sorghum bicolor]|uniref:Uncharacterized protein n=1 Tax=Sorghum bicolor TaxID=4558 RepID=A0A921R005_SORBI|nr:hypothetical protein BDA96_04G026600 [Sorghum bicolor]
MAAAAAERRHVHLCLTDHRDRTYTLHSVDVEPLFQSEPEPEPEAMDVGVPLPPPAVRFQVPPHPSGIPDATTALNFHLLGGDRIVSIDELRRTLICDAANGAGPTVGAEKYHTISASVPAGDGDRDNLYVLDHIPSERRSCFEALHYVPDRDDWYWHDLPQPPYVQDPGYGGSQVLSHAVAGAAIWTYVDGVSTYSFHTARRAWRKEGDWALPFRGKAEYVPGCNLWFGISSSPDRRLCAADLNTATASSPPEVRGVWEDFRPPREWFWNTSAIVHLGCGRLCTVRFFATDPTDKRWRKRCPVAVITALEVQVQHDGDGAQRIQMVRRRSTCIKLSNYNASVYWIL